jgi:thiol:disulfide interchange protein DsbD
MFGLYEIRLPRAISNRLGRAGSGHGGAFAMGLTVGLVAAPCVGPFLVGLLLLMTQLGNPVLGFFLFFVLGLGMGSPSLVLAMAARRAGQLPRAGEWLVWSKKALGFVLIGLALFFIRPLLPDGAAGWTAAALLLGAGVYLGWLEGSRSRTGRLTWFRRATGIACVLIAATVVWPRPPRGPALTWRPFSAAALEEARRAGRPAIVDAYADWCLPCVELDHVTFRHPQVVAALQGMATLRIDATSEVSDDAQELFRRHNVYGVPTVLLFNRRGEEQREVRIMGFIKPDEFLRRFPIGRAGPGGAPAIVARRWRTGRPGTRRSSRLGGHPRACPPRLSHHRLDILPGLCYTTLSRVMSILETPEVVRCMPFGSS